MPSKVSPHEGEEDPEGGAPSTEWLVVIRTNEAGLLGKRVALRADSIRIGRQPDCDIVLGENSVSPHHAHLERRAGQWWVVDDGWTWGTYVNDVRIAPESRLSTGDRIRIGTTVFKCVTDEDVERQHQDEIYDRRFFDELSFGAPAVEPPAGVPAPQAQFGAPPPPPPGFGGPPPGFGAPPPPQGYGFGAPAPQPPGGIAPAAPPAGSVFPAPRQEPSNERAVDSDLVRVSSAVPDDVAPGMEFLVDVVLHLSDWLVEPAPGIFADADVAAVRLTPGARLLLRLSLDANQERVLVADERETALVWAPPSSRASFRLRVAPDAEPQIAHVCVVLGTEDVELCRFYVELRVALTAPPSPRKRFALARKMPRTAFASYATLDRIEVCKRLATVQSLGIDIFLDCLDVRQGADWERVLSEAVVSQDIFLLFWSHAAQSSPWVDREWRSALSARGLEYIVPNALEPPTSCPPPAELATLQFGSRFMQLR